jgi:hypothetical protein
VGATTRVRISPSALFFLILCLKELSFEKRSDFRLLISDSRADRRFSGSPHWEFAQNLPTGSPTVINAMQVPPRGLFGKCWLSFRPSL